MIKHIHTDSEHTIWLSLIERELIPPHVPMPYLQLPEGWAPSTSFINGGQKLVAASDPADTDTNVFAAFTPLRGDYTSLGSFGNIDYVANTILPNVRPLSHVEVSVWFTCQS